MILKSRAVTYIKPFMNWRGVGSEFEALKSFITSGSVLKLFDTLSDDTVKPVLSGHSKKDKTKLLMANGSLMKVESIAECSPWSILQYF